MNVWNMTTLFLLEEHFPGYDPKFEPALSSMVNT